MLVGSIRRVHPQDLALLQLVEGHVVLVDDLFAGLGMLVEQALDDSSVDQRLLDDLGHVPDLHPLVEDALRLDDHHRAALAEAVAAGGQDVHLVGQATLCQLLAEGIGDAAGSRRPGSRCRSRW